MPPETLKLYHSTASPNSRRVRIFLAEKGLKVALVAIDLGKGEQHSASYRAINPRRVVPTLVLDDGAAVGEVPAIMRYLDEAFPEKASARCHAQGQGFDHDVGASRRTGRICGGDGGRAQQAHRAEGPRHRRST